MSRNLRRAAAHRALKLARKAARSQTSPLQQEQTTPSVVDGRPHSTTIMDDANLVIADTPNTDPGISEPGYPFPSLKEISPAHLAANQANAKKSTGATSAAGREACSQNHTIHGLARHHNGRFKLLTSERSEAFAALTQSLEAEHAPQTETESILVNAMVEALWLSQRAQRLQDSYIDPDTGHITDENKSALYLRYQTTHTRAFHKSLNDLLKLRSEKRKAELGFEAQRIATEKHEMKKNSHYWDVLKKDCEATSQMATNALQNLKAQEQHPGFEAKFEAELPGRGLKKNFCDAASDAA